MGSASTRSRSRAGTSGVAGMRQRIEQLGGAFSVASTPGRGSQVTVTISSAAIAAVASRPAEDDEDPWQPRFLGRMT